MNRELRKINDIIDVSYMIKDYIISEEYINQKTVDLLLNVNSLYSLNVNQYDGIFDIKFLSNIDNTKFIIFIYCDSSVIAENKYFIRNGNNQLNYVILSNNKNITLYKLHSYDYIFWNISTNDYWIFCNEYRQVQSYGVLLNDCYVIYDNFNLHTKFDIDLNIFKGSYITFYSDTDLIGMQVSMKHLSFLCERYECLNISCAFIQKASYLDSNSFYYFKYSSFCNEKFMVLGNSYYIILLDMLKKNKENKPLIFYSPNVPCLFKLKMYAYMGYCRLIGY